MLRCGGVVERKEGVWGNGGSAVGGSGGLG